MHKQSDTPLGGIHKLQKQKIFNGIVEENPLTFHFLINQKSEKQINSFIQA